MTDDKKRELFPYFAYIYSQQLNPERYGQVESIEDWTNLIQSNQDDIEKITQAAEQLSDEEWDALDQQYTEQAKASEDQQVISAKKGAKLMKLKKGAKKCKCGCDMITAKADGGKLVSKCACGCDVKKKEKGGEINKKIDKVKVSINKKQTGGDINQPNKVVAKKGAKLKPKMQTGGKYNESDPAKKPIDRIGKHKLGGSIIKKFLPGGSVRSYDYDWNQSIFNRNRPVSAAPRVNPRANAAYAAQIFSPDNIDRMIKAHATGQPVILPGAEVTVPKSNTPAGTVAGTSQSKPSGEAQSKPSYDTNTLWGWMKSTGYGNASFAGRKDLWNKFYGSGTTSAIGYTGTADQNARLLDALKKANSMGISVEKAASYTNLAPIKAPPIERFDPKKKLESKPLPAKESEPGITFTPDYVDPYTKYLNDQSKKSSELSKSVLPNPFTVSKTPKTSTDIFKSTQLLNKWTDSGKVPAI